MKEWTATSLLNGLLQECEKFEKLNSVKSLNFFVYECHFIFLIFTGAGATGAS